MNYQPLHPHTTQADALCAVCDGTGKTHELKLNAKQINALASRAKDPKTVKSGWRSHKPVCKGCVRHLRKNHVGPTEKQEQWVFVPAEEAAS